MILKTGNPFTGEELERLISFLWEMGLDYDRQIEYSVCFIDDGKIIATGSVHGNVIKCVAVREDRHGENLLGKVFTELLKYLSEKGITRFFGYTKPKNKNIFSSLGLYPVEETENVLLLESRRNGLKKYIEKLQMETERFLKENSIEGDILKTGAVVANCNPFTLGHRALIERASESCDIVHVFILSTEQSFMSAADRMMLVKEGTEDLKNVIVHSTSEYLVSPATFPTYFIADKSRAYSINCELDIRIFGNRIARALGITERFVGTEPLSAVTDSYNENLKKYLPDYGINLNIIDRTDEKLLKRYNADMENIVSASNVRKAYSCGDFETIRGMVPDATYRYLMKKFGEKDE